MNGKHIVVCVSLFSVYEKHQLVFLVESNADGVCSPSSVAQHSVDNLTS